MLRSSDWLDEWTLTEGFRENRRSEGALAVNSNQPAFFIRICRLRLVTSHQPLAKRMALVALVARSPARMPHRYKKQCLVLTHGERFPRAEVSHDNAWGGNRLLISFPPDTFGA